MGGVADRRTRWAASTPRRVEVTPRVLEVLKACDVVRFSRSSWLFAKVSQTHHIQNQTNFLKLLKKIYDRGLIGKVDTRKHLPNAAYQPDVYFITPLGEQTLIDHGIKLAQSVFGSDLAPPKLFLHSLMVCDIIHSVNLGAQLITQDQILAKAPVKDLRIALQAGNLKPDALFGIRRQDGSVGFFALEADRGTESHRVIRLKLQKYLELIKQTPTPLYNKHWGIPNCWPLFVTTSLSRAENMKKHLLDLTGGRGNSAILFKAWKGTASEKPPATPDIITDPWARAGYPTLTLTA